MHTTRYSIHRHTRWLSPMISSGAIAAILLLTACDSDRPLAPAPVSGPASLAANVEPTLANLCGGKCGGPILFDRFINGGLTHYVGKMNDDGSNVTMLHLGAAPAWGPGYKKIAFSDFGAFNAGQIWVMNADGTSAMAITTSTGGNTFPSWSPDGTKIAFMSYRTGSPQIFTMNVNGTNQVQLTNVAGNTYPSWSPDGTKILFGSNRTGNDDLFVMNTDGTNVTQLTNDPTVDAGGSWSPDGKQIAYTSLRPGCDIVIMNADGTGKQAVVNGRDDCENVSWSPNGAKLAFASLIPTTGTYTIFTMNVNGSSVSQIGLGRYFDVGPAWTRR
jgi:Tol biopolymer transport system component